MRRCSCWPAMVVVAGMLQGGCSERPGATGPGEPAMPGEGGGAAPQATVEAPTLLDELPELGPGLATGEHGLQAATLPTPWVRTVVGYLPPTKAGQWSGTLWRLGGDVRAQIEVRGEGAQASGKLTVGGASPVAGVGARAGPDVGGKPGTVLTFPPVTVQGREVALVAEVGHAPRAGARVFIAHDTCRQAWVVAGDEAHLLRFIEADDAPGGAMLWIDADGDGEAAEWEVASIAIPLGFAGRLRRFHLDRPATGTLTIEKYAGTVGVVNFDATDGHGKSSGVYNPGFSTPEGSVQYLGVVKTAEVPGGSARLVYGLPVSPTSIALAVSEHPVNIPANGAVEVKAGGPVEIAVQASAQRGGEVTADLKIATATGHTVGGFSGPEEGSGVVEVVGPDGEVLATGKAEFG